MNRFTLSILLTLLVLAFSLTAYSQEPAQAQEPADSARYEQSDTISLGTVSVEGASIRQKADHMDLYLKKYNLKFGNNALDAISSLSLFRDGIGNESLSNLHNENVTILINGIPSEGRDLRSFRSEDILKVEYYETAPAKYMSITKGPIANVITKRPVDRLYSAYISGQEHLEMTSGNYSAFLTYRDSLNQVKVYLSEYFVNNPLDQMAKYSYPDGIVNSFNSNSGKWETNRPTISAEYQYYDNKNLFNIRVDQTWNYSKSLFPSEYSIYDNGELFKGQGGDNQSSNAVATAVSVYYKRQFSDKKVFSLRVSNGFGNSWMRNHLWRDSEENPTIDYDITNYVKNKTYNLSVNANGEIGNLNFTGSLDYSRINQHYLGQKYTPTSLIGGIYAGYNFFREHYLLSGAIGGQIKSTKTGKDEETPVSPFAQFYARVWGDEGWTNGFALSTRFTYGMNGVPLTETTESANYMDNRFAIIGNPYLKSHPFITGSFQIAYNKPDGRLSAVLSYSPFYQSRINSSIILSDDGMFYQTTANIGHYYDHPISFGAKWRPVDWITLNPYFSYTLDRYNTPNRHVNYSRWRLGGSVTLIWNNVSFVLAGNPPIRFCNGDIFTYMSSQFAATVDWSWKRYSLGFNWHYVGTKDRVTGSGNGFSYETRENCRYNYRFVIKASIYLSKGKARQHPNAGKKYGTDTGLRSDQTIDK